MPAGGIATATETDLDAAPASRAPRLFHAAAAAWIVFLLAYAGRAPESYHSAVQEDHFIEWWTVVLFAAAFFFRFRSAWRGKRPFDLCVALFCLFVAGEEFSWGQRLLGFAPPAAFLEGNTQQELTLHNFAGIFGQPKYVLMLALLGYGLLLPALSRIPRARSYVEKLGATPPKLHHAVWFVAAVALLLWYPVDFTGEWVETLAGATFLASSPAIRGESVVRSAAVGALIAFLLAIVSGMSRGGGPAHLACAEAELSALARPLADPRNEMWERTAGGSLHKRVLSALDDGYATQEWAGSLDDVACKGSPARTASKRRAAMVDPWGMPYWIRVDDAPTGRVIEVYSMGPNRRRDDPGDDVDDDVRYLTQRRVNAETLR
jgi:hypothetical protein